MALSSFYGTVEAFLEDWYLGPGTPTTKTVENFLLVASDIVDEALICAVYAVDDDGLPTDSDIATALSEATYIQARYLMDQHSGLTGSQGPIASYSVGDVSVSYAAQNGADVPRITEDAYRRLKRDGLLSTTPGMSYRSIALASWESE